MKYTVNKTTGKLVLEFSKEEYTALPTDKKASIKSNFLFSRKTGAWISRAKWPNLWNAEKVAKSLGAENGGEIGERLNFAEQMEQKAERAEARAERYNNYAENAEKRGERLQKPINDMRGDISFFTQPNINNSAGRAFTRRRDRMFAAYDRGFEEFRKSEYFRDRAESALNTASLTKPKDKGFCDRRIKDAQKAIRDIRKTLEKYDEYILKLDDGETLKRWNGEEITREEVERGIADFEERLEMQFEKEIYYRNCIEELGGVGFSKETIAKGDIIRLKRWGRCRVVSVGTVNVRCDLLECPTLASGAFMQTKAAFAEIISVEKPCP